MNYRQPPLRAIRKELSTRLRANRCTHTAASPVPLGVRRTGRIDHLNTSGASPGLQGLNHLPSLVMLPWGAVFSSWKRSPERLVTMCFVTVFELAVQTASTTKSPPTTFASYLLQRDLIFSFSRARCASDIAPTHNVSGSAEFAPPQVEDMRISQRPGFSFGTSTASAEKARAQPINPMTPTDERVMFFP